MPRHIPPHVAWPGFIVLLFLLGAAATFSMVWIASADGGAQVVDNYYEKAVDWDATAARRESSRALGWTASISVQPSTDTAGRQLLVTITDSTGLPVSGLNGVVRLSRPQYAAPVGEVGMSEDQTLAGAYRQEIPGLRSGLWDVEIEAERDSLSFWTSVRTEVH